MTPILRADVSTRINNVAGLYAEVRIGELMANVPKAQGQRTDIKTTDTAVGKYAEIKKAGFTPKQVERFQQLAALDAEDHAGSSAALGQIELTS